MESPTAEPVHRDAVLQQYAPVDFQPYVRYDIVHDVAELDFTPRPEIRAYIHVPFCTARCHYCGYLTNTASRRWRAMQRSYLSALEVELRSFGQLLSPPSELSRVLLRALHIGGGTPSELPANYIGAIARTVRSQFDASQLSETVLEAFPGTITRAQIEALGLLPGPVKLSIGIQTFDDRQLDAVGRRHTGETAFRTLEWLRSIGTKSVSADLIVGLPGSSVESVVADVETAIEASIDHIAIYPLWLIPGTPLYQAVRVGSVALPNQEVRRRQFAAVNELLSEEGFERYSLFHYGRDGSRHAYTLAQMEDEDWIGFGPGAASSIGQEAFRNVSDLQAYVSAVASTGSGVRFACRLSEKQRMARSLAFGLRLAEYHFARFSETYGVTVTGVFGDQLRALAKCGLLAVSDQSAFVLPEGVLQFHRIEQALSPGHATHRIPEEEHAQAVSRL